MKKTAIVLFVLFLATSASAQVSWSIDKAHSSVGFKVKHLMISTVKGSFGDYDVTFTSGKKDDFSGAKLTAVLKTASIDTDNKGRDDHLKSGDFFDAEAYPEITFKSTSFRKKSGNIYTIAGDLTIRDVTKPVELEATFNGIANFRGKTVASFDVTGSINRMDYNVTWSSTMDGGGLVVGETVTFDFFIELTTGGQER